MKVVFFIAAIFTVAFCDNVKITCEDRNIQWNDLLYRPDITVYPYYTTPQLTNEIKIPNDTTYTVVNKEGEYIIIREYKKVDTLKVKVQK